MRRWFHIVARGKSSELFVLNVLLVTLGLAYVTEEAGLSLALGAFVAGMLISETEYRHQVEEDIKPFRDVLMGPLLCHHRRDAQPDRDLEPVLAGAVADCGRAASQSGDSLYFIPCIWPVANLRAYVRRSGWQRAVNLASCC